MSPQLYTYVRSIRHFFGKHHPVIFITLISLLVATAVVLLLNVLQASGELSSNTNSSIGGFDQKTVDKIKQLHNSTDTNDMPAFPSPRANPFAE